MPGATGWAVFRLQAGNLLVSTVPLGLLHPVAIVRNAAFRARHLRLDRAPELSAARQAERGPGTGEGAADLFGASAFWWPRRRSRRSRPKRSTTTGNRPGRSGSARA